jgi:general stress protein 26
MTIPATTIDRRYSDPSAEAVEWDQTRKTLESAELFWLTTVRADGRPHVTPVVAAWADGAIHFTTGTEEQKFANLRVNQHVVMTTGCNAWDRGLDVVVEGRAVQVTEREALERIAPAFTGKWDGRWQFGAVDGGFWHPGGFITMVFTVRPVKVFAHAKGDPFGATTHRL